jgi:hypothetical protein
MIFYSGSLLLLFVKQQKQRLKAMLYLFLTLLASYYFAYTLVWEYHYTTIMAAMPCILWLYNKEESKWLKYAIVAGLVLYLPTTYVLLKPTTDERILVMQLCKVVPVTLILFILLYGTFTKLLSVIKVPYQTVDN